MIGILAVSLSTTPKTGIIQARHTQILAGFSCDSCRVGLGAGDFCSRPNLRGLRQWLRWRLADRGLVAASAENLGLPPF